MTDHDYDLDQDDECALCGGPLVSDGVCADDDCGDDEPHYPIFSTYSQRRAVLNGLPEVGSSPNPSAAS